MLGNGFSSPYKLTSCSRLRRDASAKQSWIFVYTLQIISIPAGFTMAGPKAYIYCKPLSCRCSGCFIHRDIGNKNKLRTRYVILYQQPCSTPDV